MSAAALAPRRVQTPARRRKPEPTFDGRVPGMRHQARNDPIYVVGDYAECGPYSWFRQPGRRLWTVSTELLGKFVWVDAITDDFGNLVAVRGVA